MLRKAIFLVIAACVDRGGHCEPVAAARGANPLENGPFMGSVPKLSPEADAVSGLLRRDGMSIDGISRRDVGINVGVDLTHPEEAAMKAILRNPKLTAPRLGELLDMTSRQAERIIASLKKKAGLVREGSRKSGMWRFPSDIQA